MLYNCHFRLLSATLQRVSTQPANSLNSTLHHHTSKMFTAVQHQNTMSSLDQQPSDVATCQNTMVQPGTYCYKQSVYGYTTEYTSTGL